MVLSSWPWRRRVRRRPSAVRPPQPVDASLEEDDDEEILRGGSQPVSARIPTDDYEKLMRIVHERDLTVSQVVRAAIASFVRQHQNHPRRAQGKATWKI